MSTERLLSRPSVSSTDSSTVSSTVSHADEIYDTAPQQSDVATAAAGFDVVGDNMHDSCRKGLDADVELRVRKNGPGQ